jgi:hypothetical protein
MTHEKFLSNVHPLDQERVNSIKIHLPPHKKQY